MTKVMLMLELIATLFWAVIGILVLIGAFKIAKFICYLLARLFEKVLDKMWKYDESEVE